MNEARIRSRNRGVALLSSLLAIVVVSALAAALFTTARSEMVQSQTYRVNAKLVPLAEAASVAAEHLVLVQSVNLQPPPTAGDVTLGGHLATYEVAPVGVDRIDRDRVGIQTLHRKFQIDSRAELRGQAKTIHRVIDVGLTPIFQFAIFYDKDLELLPGPSMTLSGRVHSNEDIYVGCGGTLNIKADYFRSVGDIFRRRKNTGDPTGGQVNVQRMDTTNLYKMYSRMELAGMGVPSDSGFDSSFQGFDRNSDGDLDDPGEWPDFLVGSLQLWDGSVQTGAHGMKRIEPPDIGSIKRFEDRGAGGGSYSWNGSIDDYEYVGEGNGTHDKGRYHSLADVVIRDGKITDGTGTVILVPPGTITETAMYDARERQMVNVTEVDMALLKNSGEFPDNGLLYASRSDSSPGDAHGVRFKNAAELAGPLTVVSENPVYLWGDYNTQNKKPAAVMSDAVNLLSNDWDDSKRPGNLPKATETSFNAAMITGGDETEGSSYCGGFENLPRFHENWSGVNCRLLGSFVKIFASEFANGAWRYGGDRYTAPRRLWDYDLDFNNVENLPPFTPNVAQVKSIGWWE